MALTVAWRSVVAALLACGGPLAAAADGTAASPKPHVRTHAVATQRTSALLVPPLPALPASLTTGGCAQSHRQLSHLLSPYLTSPTPQIVYILSDNLGWGNVGYHRKLSPAGPSPEVVTPNLDQLVASGIELDRFYTYKFCSPSRSSLMTGRFAQHVNMHNLALTVPRHGIPVEVKKTHLLRHLMLKMIILPRQARNKHRENSKKKCALLQMTTIASKLKTAGYATHAVGKW
jgi:hypothetical protein